MIKTADKSYQGRWQQGIALGVRYARLLAPARGGRVAVIELMASMSLGMALAWLVLPQNPLLLGMSFPWAWLLPMVLALRYGTLIGVGSVLMLLGGWFVFQLAGVPLGPFPRMFFLGGLLLVLVAGQFGDVWETRLARARALNRYLDERLAALTKNHYLLRISHARLENDLLARPTTLRDTLSQLRQLAHNEAAQSSHRLAGAQAMLSVVVQACQIEAAALYASDGEHIDPAPVAVVGQHSALSLDDPLVQHCMETRQLAHLQAEDMQRGTQTRYVAVAPLLAGSDRIIGVLVVERMPFLALTHENLLLLTVLLGYYADGVEHAAASHAVQKVVPACPYHFALDYARLSKLRREAGIESAVVALVFDTDAERDALFDQVLRSRRALDVSWSMSNASHRAVLTLMPLSDAEAVSGYLARIEDMLHAQFATDFTKAGIGIYTLLVPEAGSANALLQLLQRARLTDSTALPASSPSAAASGASHA